MVETFTGTYVSICNRPVVFGSYNVDTSRDSPLNRLMIQMSKTLYVIIENFKATNFIKTLMFTDDQVSVDDDKDNLQRTLHEYVYV